MCYKLSPFYIICLDMYTQYTAAVQLVKFRAKLGVGLGRLLSSRKTFLIALIIEFIASA